MWGEAMALLFAALVATGCGDSPLRNATGPSLVTAPASVASVGTFSPRYVPGVNSCPDGELVRNIRVNVSQGGTALIQWDEVASIREYVVRIARYQTGATEVTDSVKRAVVQVKLSDSTYIVYVRTQNDCGGFGPEGEGVVFSIDGPNVPVTVPVIIVPPIDPPPPPPCLVACEPPPPPPVDPPVVCENGDHNNDGHCDSGNPPDGNGDGNGGGNGNGDNPPPPPPPPPDPDVTFCHVSNGNGSQTLTLPSSQAQAQHLSQHESDYLGACIVVPPPSGHGHGH
jgi:hypothetical protein